MKALTDDKLWNRICTLKGKVIPTCDIGRPNPIRSIRGNLVEIAGRETRPSRKDLYWCYQLALKHGVLTESNLPSELFQQRRTARICIALLAAAVPEQIRCFRRGKGPPVAQGLSGIEVYNKDC